MTRKETMTHITTNRLISSLCILIVCTCATLRAQEQAPHSQNDVYKVEYVLSEFQDSKRVNARSYTALVRQMDMGNIRVGSRIPIPVGSFSSSQKEGVNPLVNTQFQYVDAGVKVDCVVEPMDSSVILSTDVDVNSIAPEQNTEPRIGGPIMRQNKLHLKNIVPLGKSTVISSVDQMDGTDRFQVEVTVSRVK